MAGGALGLNQYQEANQCRTRLTWDIAQCDHRSRIFCGVVLMPVENEERERWRQIYQNAWTAPRMIRETSETLEPLSS
jgi:hypothetical protein